MVRGPYTGPCRVGTAGSRARRGDAGARRGRAGAEQGGAGWRGRGARAGEGEKDDERAGGPPKPRSRREPGRAAPLLPKQSEEEGGERCPEGGAGAGRGGAADGYGPGPLHRRPAHAAPAARRAPPGPPGRSKRRGSIAAAGPRGAAAVGRIGSRAQTCRVAMPGGRGGMEWGLFTGSRKGRTEAEREAAPGPGGTREERAPRWSRSRGRVRPQPPAY